MWHLERHWPGQGSFSQVLIFKRTLLPHLLWKAWDGRAAGILLSAKAGKKIDDCSPGECTLVLYLHAKSGGDICDILVSSNRLIARAPRGCKIVALGDWNLDPTAARDNLGQVHWSVEVYLAENLNALLAWLQSKKVRISMPTI
jgi:hypothetical protein